MFEYLSVGTQSHKTVSITLAEKGEDIHFNVFTAATDTVEDTAEVTTKTMFAKLRPASAD